MLFTMSADVDVVNILHFTFTGANTIAEMDAFATRIQTSFGTNLKAQLSNDLSLHEVICTDLTTTSAPVGLDSTIVTCTGGAGALAAQVAFLFNHQIGRRYRGGKPRTYLAGPRDANLGASDQEWDTTFAAALEGHWNTFITDCLGLLTTVEITAHANVSYYSGFTVVINPITGRARNVPTLRGAPVVDGIINSRLNPRPATQRRRSLL
jgi:hypothetical protein